MRALVTGGTGFIGSNLVRELLAQGMRVRVLIRKDSDRRNLASLAAEIAVGDLTDRASLERAVAGCSFVFHAAASYVFWSKNPSSIYAANVRGTENILHAAVHSDVRKVVYTSTESTIGIEGDSLGTEARTASINQLAGDYKRSKLLAEQIALEYCRKGAPIVIVNPTMPIGPWDIKPTPSGQVVVDFLNRRMPAYVNTGLNIIDVRDVAKGHLLALEKGRLGERYILGHQNVTLQELLHVLAEVTGREAPRIRIPMGVALVAGIIDETVRGRILGKPPRIPLAAVKTARKFRHFDCSKAIEELGLPQTPIDQAFQAAIRWFHDRGYIRGVGTDSRGQG